MTHTHNRFLMRRYLCEGCDVPIHPDERICEQCKREELARELEEDKVD
jgi:predicted amidophosphoribosyltransferase